MQTGWTPDTALLKIRKYDVDSSRKLIIDQGATADVKEAEGIRFQHV